MRYSFYGLFNVYGIGIGIYGLIQTIQGIAQSDS
jgi:hypothetical protein